MWPVGQSGAADEDVGVPGAFRISTFSFPHYEEREYSGSRGAAEHAERIQFSSLRAPAPPREKKSRRHLSVFSFPNVRFSSVAGVADPGRGAERLSERLFGREPDLN